MNLKTKKILGYLGVIPFFVFSFLPLLSTFPEGYVFKRTKKNIFMNFPGIFLGTDNSIPAYGISQAEVSNQQYKQFIEDGGYENPRF